jgi:hypothetical protein
MTRPLFPALALPLLGSLAIGLIACSGPDPAVAPPSPIATVRPPLAAPPPPGPPTAPLRATTRGGTPLPPPVPPAAPGPGQVFSAPAPGQAARDQAAVAAACRQDADRIVLYRDRGQLMREDERDSRVGTDASIYARRMETDRLGRIFERDRIAADCVQQNTRSAPLPR